MTTKNVVFIDSRVAGYETLIAGLSADTEWCLLDANQDGVDQMQRILAGYSELDSVQVISHGSVGTLYLGSTVLSGDNLSSYQTQLQAIGSSLTETGDILLYGCNVAQGDVGVSFVNSLAQITGADVAASDDLSGGPGQIGDSVLEVTTGSVESGSYDLTSLISSLASLVGTDGNDTLEGTVDNDTILGGAGSDNIKGSGGADWIEGGDETAYEWEGDNIEGGPGNDTILGGAGRDYLYGNTGNDSLDGGAGNDYLQSISGEGNDTLNGGDGNDTLYINSYSGTSESVLMVGGGGDDTFQTYISTYGNRTITATGGTGVDTYFFSSGGATANYAVTDFSAGIGGDRLDVSKLLDYSAADGRGYEGGNPMSTTNGYLRLLQSGADTLLQYDEDGAVGTGHTWHTAITLKNVAATAITADNFVGNIPPNGSEVAGLTLNGTGTSETLEGSHFNDTILGGAGSDNIKGSGGADWIEGGDETAYEWEGDNIEGGPGNDTILGGAGRDYLYGNTGNDSLDGGAGNDYLQSISGEGNDTLNGGDGNDTLYINSYSGTSESVLMVGGGGDDTFQTYISTYGNRTITATGGTGVDTYFFSSGGATANYAVTDFSAGIGGDRLDVSKLLDYSAADGRGYEGGNPMSTTNGYLRLLQSGADTLLQYDEDGAVGTGHTWHTAITLKNVAATAINAHNFKPLTIEGTAGADTLDGGLGVDTLNGGGGDDVLDGNWGDDSMTGGTGNDTYYVDNLGDLVKEVAGEGADKVIATIDYVMAGNVENLDLGSGASKGTGNALNNVINGNSASNTLNGGSGADTLAGGAGNDTYYVDNLGDVVNEVAGQGTDRVVAYLDYTLGSTLENLTLGGTGNIKGAGNGANNSMAGNAGNNILDGGAGNDSMNGGDGNDSLLGGDGADTVIGGVGSDTVAGGVGADSLVGGTGDDVYIVDNLGDLVSEVAGEGADKVIALIDYVMSGEIENLDLGSGASRGTGNALANIMQANDNGNELQGGGGNDQLRGGKGNDKLQGGDGDDRVDAGEGNDEIVGGDGAGNDTYVGGVGTDTVRYTSAITGITVDLTLGTASGNEIGSDTLSEIENVIGGQAGDSLKGNSQANNIDGYTGNDTINGYGGADTLVGGQGSDSYYVDLSTDVVTENLNEGTDTVYSTATAFTLSANVENGRIYTSNAASLTGNTLNNVIYAGAGNNSLVGGDGTDTLSYYYGVTGITGVTVSLASTTAQTTGGSGTDTISGFENLYGSNNNDSLTGSSSNNVLNGYAGTDTLVGGAGDDTYYVDVAGDVIIETSTGGKDLVLSSFLGTYVMGNYVEEGRINSTGAANLTGNSLSNLLYAGAGNNILNGGTGTEADTVSYLYGLISGATLGVNVSLLLTTGQNTGRSGNDTLTNIENLTGSSLNDTLTGSAGNNVLDGGLGTDSLVGGLGNDTYVINTSADKIVENASEGTDTVNVLFSGYTLGANLENGRISTTVAANLTGNSLSNFIYAGKGNNVIDGGTGTDSVSFYEGNNGTGVTASLLAGTAMGGSGTDTLISIERLYGTNYADKFIGNAGANYLRGYAGNDTLDGGTGNDSMVGDDGNDIYYVRDAGDVVSETNATASTGGTDTVYSYLTHSATQTYTLGANIENGRIVATTASNMTGNVLSNTIYAGAGNNLISGGTGTEIDTVSYQYGLFSGATSGINANLATGIITGTSGTDTLTRIENLIGSSLNDTLVGSTGNNSLNGGSGNDSLSGGDGNDTLIGGAGKDTLVGGNGNDIFDFNALSEMGTTSATRDVISSFVRGQDKIDLSTLDANTATTTNDVFDSLTVGGTFSGSFASAGELYFDNVARVLYGNTDGDVTAEFAIQLTGVTTLATSDFML